MGSCLGVWPCPDCLKQEFLSELVRLGNIETLPILIGGDFNILRSPCEKNNDRFDHRWPFLFNAVIDGLDMRELHMSGRRYTWANTRDNPTYEKLDWILVATEWEGNSLEHRYMPCCEIYLIILLYFLALEL
jgi:hypothetical protein